MVLFEFTKDSDLTNWAVVDDGVMGGRSAGNFSLNDEGNATFYGSVIFSTTGEWETVSIPLAKMEPRFRGRRLDMPNYPAKVLEEIAILVSNKKAEMFKLEIDKITVR